MILQNPDMPPLQQEQAACNQRVRAGRQVWRIPGPLHLATYVVINYLVDMLADLFPCCRDGAEADKSRQAFASLDDETDDTSSSESSRWPMRR